MEDVSSVPSLLEFSCSLFSFSLLPCEMGIIFFSWIFAVVHQWNHQSLESFTPGGFDCELYFLTDEGLFIFSPLFCIIFCDSFKESFDLYYWICWNKVLILLLYFSIFMIYNKVIVFNSLNFVFCFFFSFCLASSFIILLILSKNQFLISLIFLSSFHFLFYWVLLVPIPSSY